MSEPLPVDAMPPQIEIKEVSEADILDLVDLHMEVFDGSRHLGVLFGRSYLTRMYTVAVQDEAFLILKASEAGRLVGFASARLDGYHAVGLSSLDRHAMMSFLRNLRTVLAPTMLRRLIGRQLSERKLRRMWKKPCAQAYITCVRGECRGSGIGSQLRQHIYSECRRRGVAYLYTGILMDNSPMLAISRRDGFQEIFSDRVGQVVYLEKRLE